MQELSVLIAWNRPVMWLKASFFLWVQSKPLNAHTDSCWGRCDVRPGVSPHIISLSWCQATIWNLLLVSGTQLGPAPGVRHPSGTCNQFFPPLPLIILDSFGFVEVGRPLWREVGSVVLSFCWVTSAVFLRSESHGTHDHILLPQFLRLPNLEGQVPVFISPRNSGSQSYSPALDISSLRRSETVGLPSSKLQPHVILVPSLLTFSVVSAELREIT
jgi:hypothetical protein